MCALSQENKVRLVETGEFHGITEYDVAGVDAFTVDDMLPLFTARTYVSDEGITLPYRIYLPDGFRPDGTFPLFLMLHGGGLRGRDNVLQLTGGDMALKYALLRRQKKERCVIVIPQCPAGAGVFWSQSMTWDGQDYFVNITDDNESPVIRALIGLVDNLCDELKPDGNRLYIGGWSMGGMGQYDLLYRRPALFAAAFIGCAASDVTVADVVARTPVFLMHGDADVTVKVEGSRRMAAALAALGADYRYVEWPGRGHGFILDSTELDEMLDWVFSKTKT